jgi:AcrR family transcriptional regulator
MASAADPEVLDPRTRRTRAALQQALELLLAHKDFEKISVQDIAEAAELNRATFYDHYPDKFALLESMVECRFNQLLQDRAVVFSGCSSALRAMILGVCDFLATTPRLDCARQRQLEPHWESAVIAVVRRMILCGLEREGRANASMIATTVSWAIYGAAKEWVFTPNRVASEEIVEAVIPLITPILSPPGELAAH